MKMYVPPCLGNTVASSAQQRPPARARSPDTSQTSRHTPQDPTARRIELAVMKIPDPTIVPVTKEVDPTEIFDPSQLCHCRQCSHQSRVLAQPQHSSSNDTSRLKYLDWYVNVVRVFSSLVYINSGQVKFRDHKV